MKIAVVIPAHNEARTIGPLVESVRALGHDCIVIDDGSQDKTGELARQAKATVLKTQVKGGKGNALKMGFDCALKGGYDALITMDGDGQHAPSDIAGFIECCEKCRADVVN